MVARSSSTFWSTVQARSANKLADYSFGLEAGDCVRLKAKPLENSVRMLAQGRRWKLAVLALAVQPNRRSYQRHAGNGPDHRPVFSLHVGKRLADAIDRSCGNSRGFELL